MPLTISYDELLRYTTEERDKWRGWFGATRRPWRPRSSRAAGCRRSANSSTTSFSSSGGICSGSGRAAGVRTGLTGSNAPPLFDYGASVRRELEQIMRTLGEEVADEIRTFKVREQKWPMSSRKLLFHILVHEMRHWAQIALAVRLAGLDPPGDHDLFFSKALR